MLHVQLPERDNLAVTSYALVEHCRSIASHRIIEPRIGQLTHKEIAVLQHRLKILLGI